MIEPRIEQASAALLSAWYKAGCMTAAGLYAVRFQDG